MMGFETCFAYGIHSRFQKSKSILMLFYGTTSSWKHSPFSLHSHGANSLSVKKKMKTTNLCAQEQGILVDAETRPSPHHFY